MTLMISGPVILLFLIASSLMTSSDADLVKKEADMLVKSFNLSSNISINVVQDKLQTMTMGANESVIRTFMFSGSSSSRPSLNNLKQNSGYYPIQNTHDARMFYFFFESRRSRKDPVILWLAGGPGCGSEIALFYETGPFHIKNDLSLKWNDFGWDKVSNIIFVDQPIGTGFSYSSDDRDIRHNTNEISNDLYYFMQAFYQDHPKFVENDFYIVGQSYAGHYIPVLASRLHNANIAHEGIHINLKGFAIGNGFVDPVHMYSSLTDYAYSNNVISKADYKKLGKRMPECVKTIQQCQYDDNVCEDSYATCNRIFQRLLKIIDNINHYDIRKQCEGELCYDFSKLKNFLTLDSVKRAIGVRNIEYEFCSKIVKNALISFDWMKNYDRLIPPLLEYGIKVFIFAGEYDLLCNWLGVSRWVNELEWSGQGQFSRTKLISYRIGAEEVGQIKSYGPLTFMKVHNAGHMVPMDQPEVSLQMLQNWMNE